MAQDSPARHKSYALYHTLQLGVDHVMAKKVPHEMMPLPACVKLHTEEQSLSTTWANISTSYEKRKGMMAKRRLKKKKKLKDKQKDKKKTKQQEEEDKPKQKSKLKPKKKEAKPLTVKKEKKMPKSPRQVKSESSVSAKEELPADSYDAHLLKKIRRISMCKDLVYGSNKYRVIVKWLELDQGGNGGASKELTDLLAILAKRKASKKPSLSRKRSLDSLDDVLESERRNRKRKMEKRRAADDDDDEEMEYGGGYSDSDEAEYMPELYDSPPRGEKKKTRNKKQTPKKKKTKETVKKEEKALTTTKQALNEVVSKIRADKVISGDSETKYLSYKDKPAKTGRSSSSAIVLDDSDEEEEEEAEEAEEDSEEETKGHESSTDEDNDLFDLNEEDVYVVEAILCVKEGRSLLSAGVRRPKEADLYLVKWDGYDELTWEPDENIPQRLIQMFRERERAKRACQYQIKTYHERKVVTNVTTGTKEIIYMVQWINQEMPVWEARSTLPSKTALWLDKVLGVEPPSLAKKRRETKAARKYVYQ